MITKEDVVKDFTAGIDCSQVVLRECSGKLGLSGEQACKIASPFGGGMFRGDTCGAVSGALLALGLQYGHCRSGDLEAKGRLAQKTAAFQKQFSEKHGSTICRDLIDFDLSKEGEFEKAAASGQLFERCPVFVCDALEILNQLLGNHSINGS
ncbi:MAG: C-GCAxxG-C-C family protein [Treponema sp.]|nr:C-GCAxxG-C-C family protein [Treponema sp.]